MRPYLLTTFYKELTVPIVLIPMTVTLLLILFLLLQPIQLIFVLICIISFLITCLYYVRHLRTYELTLALMPIAVKELLAVHVHFLMRIGASYVLFFYSVYSFFALIQQQWSWQTTAYYFSYCLFFMALTIGIITFFLQWPTYAKLLSTVYACIVIIFLLYHFQLLQSMLSITVSVWIVSAVATFVQERRKTA